MIQPHNRTSFITQTALIAALYAALTLFSYQVMGYLTWGPIQLRISEALVVLAFFTPAAVPGLTLGTFIANLFNLTTAGALGWFDVIFGTLATLLGTYWMWRLRGNPKLALLGPVVANALIVPAYLPLILRGMGWYTIPFTSVSTEGSYLAMYAFGVVGVGVGEAIVVYGLGMPLRLALARTSAHAGEEETDE